jgi:hypothetical protein
MSSKHSPSPSRDSVIAHPMSDKVRPAATPFCKNMVHTRRVSKQGSGIATPIYLLRRAISALISILAMYSATAGDTGCFTWGQYSQDNEAPFMHRT